MTWSNIKCKLALILSRRREGCDYHFDPRDRQIRSILCLPPSGIGDVVMQAPAIAALKEAYPQAHLTVLGHANRHADEVCELMPGVDEMVDIGLSKYAWPALLRYLLSRFWTLSCRLRKRRYDLVVSFLPNPVRKLLLLAVSRKYWIYGHSKAGFPGQLARDMLDHVGILVPATGDVFSVPETTNPQTSALNSCKRPIIGIHPFSGASWKEWNHFDDLIRTISTLDATVVVVGKKAHYHANAAVTDLVNKLTLAELFWVIRRCDVFVTADSGPMHIAIALNVPTVALFGVVKPSLLVPKNKRDNVRALYRPSSISERGTLAGARKRLDNQAMQSISVDEVMKEVTSVLRDRGQAV